MTKLISNQRINNIKHNINTQAMRAVTNTQQLSHALHIDQVVIDFSNFGVAPPRAAGKRRQQFEVWATPNQAK